MKKECITIKVDVEVWGKRAVIKAARDMCRRDKLAPGTITDWQSAVQYLIDPGSLPGCDILQSSINGHHIDFE